MAVMWFPSTDQQFYCAGLQSPGVGKCPDFENSDMISNGVVIYSNRTPDVVIEANCQNETSPPLSAEDLLRAAFKYQDALTSYGYALLRDWALAQDAVQETFIVLQKKHAEFRPGANVFTWARQILRFEALKVMRARGRESYVADEELFALVDAQFEEHLDADAVARLEQQKGALQHCMARLDNESLDLLLGFYRERQRCEELANARRRSVNAIRLVLSRTRARLRECVRSRLSLLEVRS